MALTAAGSGLAGAVFLHGLDWVTGVHRAHPHWVWALPVLGVVVWLAYRRWAGIAEQGTNLLIEACRQPPGPHPVPFRLAPLILLGTLLTHLGGGSAGREGTAIQMGGGIGGGIGSWVGVDEHGRRLVVLAGMAACFGAVFGTPFAAALFVVEFIRPGSPDWRALPACGAAAWLGHGVCLAAGAAHAHYPVELPASPGIAWRWLAGMAAVGLASGLIARGYRLTAKAVRSGFQAVTVPWLRPVVGGLLVAGLATLLGSRASLGLGAVPMDPGDASLATAFEPGAVSPWAWALKLAFTAITLGSGFKGGEVTPLFFMGATAGHTAAEWIGIPVALGAAVGMMAVFSGASRAPIACVVMGMELFGPGLGHHLVIGCVAALLTAGRNGIYEAQARMDKGPDGGRRGGSPAPDAPA